MKIYLSGGMKDGWQDVVRDEFPDVQFLDPREHGLTRAKDYTKKDLEMIDECDMVWGYMPLSNPSGIGLAAELGYAKAKGKPIYLAVESTERMWDFVKHLANEWVGGSEEYPLLSNAIAMFKQVPMRVLVWISAGAASAVAGKKALEKYGKIVELLYCDTLEYEHPDNGRFLGDLERWYGQPIKFLKSKEYTDIYDVFEKTRFLNGPHGARCTVEMKKVPRMDYEKPGDIHIMGYTKEESDRVKRFEKENPDVRFEWILEDTSKIECLQAIADAGIEVPKMYKLGYGHNNCIGCVKGGMGYWNKIRKDFPDHFDKMAKMERKLNFALTGTFLDELDPKRGRFKEEPSIECGVLCQRS